MNGNDYIEIIQDHTEEIEDDFLNQFTQQELQQYYLEDYTLQDIKDKNNYDDFANEWVEYYLQRSR